MTKRKYKEERKKILEKYGKPMSEFPDEELKDEKSGSWIWLMDSVDYKRQNRIGEWFNSIRSGISKSYK